LRSRVLTVGRSRSSEFGFAFHAAESLAAGIHLI
jgi:hypothetical protein